MPAQREGAQVIVAEIAIVVYDGGPEPDWHKDGKLHGPWWRYQAELADYPVVRELGTTPYEAARRLVANHRGLLERRWSV
jgi:hypothetical protein